MRPLAFIFDMDGVLIDTEALYVAANQAFFREQNIEVPLEEHLRFVGASGVHMWSELKRRYNLRQDVETLVEYERERIYKTLLSLPTLPVVPGIPGLIERLSSQGVYLGVASSSPRRAVQLVLDRLGLKQKLPAVVSGDEVQRGKPEPDIFLVCCSRLGVPPSRAVVLEDSMNGVRAARSAGTTVIGFASHSAVPQDLSAAHIIVDRIDERIDRFLNSL